MANSKNNTQTTIGRDVLGLITARCAGLTIEQGKRVNTKDWIERHLLQALQAEGVEIPPEVIERVSGD